MREPAMLSNSRKVTCLKDRTGWSHKETHEFLKGRVFKTDKSFVFFVKKCVNVSIPNNFILPENNWNLDQALSAYNLMIESYLIPSKNINVLQEKQKSFKKNDNFNSITSSIEKEKSNKSLNILF